MSDEKPQKVELSDKVELAIRDEVEKRLDHPSGEFVKFIEAEIEQRVSARVKQYKMLAWVVGILLGAFISAFSAFLWHQTIAEAGREAIRQLAGTEAVKAGKRIIDLAGEVDVKSQRVNALVDDVAKNHDEFTKRLEQIQQQDNAVLFDKGGLLNLKGPVRFYGDVTFDRTMFSGIAFVYGQMIQLKGPPLAFIRVDLSHGTAEYNLGPMPIPQPPLEMWFRTASTFGDIIIR